jgi:hypothetical protein
MTEMVANNVPRPQDSDPYGDRRAYPRVAVAMPAFLQAMGERHFVQLHDLSSGGAKLSCAAELAAGTAVTLDCGTLRRTATVRWRNGEFLGVCFDHELDEREISALIDRADALAARMDIKG